MPKKHSLSGALSRYFEKYPEGPGDELGPRKEARDSSVTSLRCVLLFKLIVQFKI